MERVPSIYSLYCTTTLPSPQTGSGHGGDSLGYAQRVNTELLYWIAAGLEQAFPLQVASCFASCAAAAAVVVGKEDLRQGVE